MSNRLTLGSFLVALAALFAVALAVEEIPRVMYPWDMRIFSESAFLTNMLKMSAGQSPHTDPADCNSFIYAPGLEYVTYALLRPLRAQLDIRACRAVCCAIGVGAAVLVGRLGSRFAQLLDKGAQRSRAAWAVGTVLAAAIIFKSYTSDACHPDNLYIFHAALLFTLTFAALRSARFEHALAAVAVGALALTIKQTAALGAAGATLLLLYYHRRAWGAGRSLALLVWGLVWGLFGAYVLFHGWGRFWAFTVPGNQPVEFFRLNRLLATYSGQVPFRPMLALAFGPSALYLAVHARKDDALRKLFAAWLVVGSTEVVTSLISYFKAWGYWNNVTIVDLWMLMPVLGVAWHAMRAGGSDLEGAGRRAAGAGFLFVLFVALTPTRAWPTHEEYEAGRALDDAIEHDRAAGKRLTVSFGVASLVHNGIDDVPLDRHGSAAELAVAHMESRSGTKERIERRYYDKLYVVVSARYDDDIMSAIAAHYHQVGELAAVHPPRLYGGPDADWDALGNMWFFREGVRIFEANP